MISELVIEKYRGLHNLELRELGKINIIAGANNTGKTSILEVIKSLEAPNSLMAWRRIGRREGVSAAPVTTTIYDTMKALFPLDDEQGYVVSYYGRNDDKDFKVNITGQFTTTVVNEEQLDNLNRIRGMQVREESTYGRVGHEYETTVLNIKYDVNDIACGTDVLYGIMRGLPYHEKEEVCLIDNIVYVSPTQHAQNMFYLNSLMMDSDLYEEFIEIMREFDPGFISVNAVEEERTYGRKYIVLSKRFKEGLLLNAYGDGMKKAMLLLSAVLRAKNGILLLDEFETAIHVSAMGKVFKWIMETADRLNVQIFMTSHSLEAIATVLKCCPELKSDIRMLTLVNVDNNIKVRNIDAVKAIQLMDEYGMELR